MHTFWLDQIGEDTATLSAADARHATQVLRLKTGEEVGGVDGHGLYVAGALEVGGKDKATLRIHVSVPEWGEPPVKTTLCFALLKHRERMEWLVEKATELGVTRLIPLQAQRSERAQFNAERMQRILVAVLKQNHRSRLPDLLPPQPLVDALPFLDGPTVVGYCEAAQPLQSYTSQLKGKHVTYCIGPEGDFTPEEIALLEANGAYIVSFGQTRLRAETASLFALSWNKGLQGY